MRRRTMVTGRAIRTLAVVFFFVGLGGMWSLLKNLSDLCNEHNEDVAMAVTGVLKKKSFANALTSSASAVTNFSYSLPTLSTSPSITTAKVLNRRKGRYWPYTYTDPKKYQGKVVIPGWEPNKSRSMNNYIKPGVKSALLEPDVSRNATDMIVAICSSPGNFELREAIRRTWKKYDWKFVSSFQQTVNYIFVIGKPSDQELQKKIEEEHRTKKDILQEDFEDAYYNLTLKTMFSLKFALEYPWVRPFRYVLKCDDDTYINIPEFFRIANDLSESSLPMFMLGHLHSGGGTNPAVLTPRMRLNDRLKKYVCPSYMYDGRNYPQVVSGSGYLMDYAAAKCLYSTGLQIPFFHLEDVFLSGFAGQACDVPLVHNSGIKYQKQTDLRLLQSDTKALLLHYVKASMMDKLHRKFKRAKGWK